MNHITRSLFLIGTTLAISITGAQTPTHQHVQHNTVGSSQSEVNGVAHDSQGNMIVCGGRMDALDFGGTAHEAGTGGIFVAKFGPGGSEIWSKIAGSAETMGNHKAMSVAVDGSDNVYVAGWLFVAQAATFDGTTLPAGSLGFVAKYSASGTLTWVKEFSANVNAIAVDGNGVPFINLGDQTILKLDPANGSETASGAGGGDLMNVLYHNIVVDGSNNIIAQWGNKIRKYDNALNEIWSTPLVKAFGAESFRISVDNNGLVWASFYAVFGTVTLAGTDYTTFPNGYIYHLDGADGGVMGCVVLTPGGTASKPQEVINDGSSNLYVSGTFAFNAPYIVKVDPSFTTIWSVPTFNVEDMDVQGLDCLLIGGSHAADITLDGTTYTRPNGSGQDNAMAAYLCAGGVGMDEQGAVDVTVFPNPTDGLIALQIPAQAIGSNYQVVDLTGSEALTGRVTGRSMDLDLSSLAGGCYVLKIVGAGIAPVRVVKQ
ncbi:MAG TPA: T9SS type A sorting domain-containing protein [Flavobacteriales bacterium]|nr:T9SS type A sorting domain-containing protein [Flavobacteriales bacterium]